MVPARRIVLAELDGPRNVPDLPDDVARHLGATGLVDTRQARTGWWLTPRGTVGVVRAGDTQVEVRSKDAVPLSSLLFLLGYARNPGFRPEDVDGVADDDLWAAMGVVFAQSVTTALARGMLQGYRTVEESLPTVRGRIDLATQLATRPGVAIPIAVRFDDYQVDTPENRILRTALHRMAAVPDVPPRVRGQLRALHARLDGAGLLHPRDPVPTWRPTRLNTRYQPALRLAELILRSVSVAPGGASGLRVAAFVVEPWQVFEDFVTTALTEALRPHPGSCDTQLKAYLAGPGDWRTGDITMLVDLVHRAPDGRPLAVVDAKYKVASAGGRFSNADLYQMLAYCTALDAPTAWLVYAAGSASPRARRIKHAGVTVVEHPLDLSRPPVHLLGQISRLAEDVRTLGSRSAAAAVT